MDKECDRQAACAAQLTGHVPIRHVLLGGIGLRRPRERDLLVCHLVSGGTFEAFL